MQKLIKIGFLAGLSALSSCTTFHEVHFFKDHVDGIPNYYKLTVSGHTRLISKTRYYSGYFAEDAIDVYFNEFSQPANGSLDSVRKISSLSDANKGKQLVMILSSNADDIATQIGNITQTTNTVNAVVSLANGDQYKRLLTSKRGVSKRKTQNKLLVELGESLLTGLETKTQAEAQKALLQYTNALATELGHADPFDDLDKAKAWFDQGKFLLVSN